MGLRCETGISGVDSSIILRFLLRDVPEQADKAMKLFMNGNDYYVDEITVVEVVHILTIYGKSRQVIAKNVLGLLDNVMFIWDMKFFEEVFERYLKQTDLSFEDAVLAQRLKDAGCKQLWTLNQSLVKHSKLIKLLD